MKTTQITHNDLDGYGASTVVGVTIAVERVIHIARYRDMAGVINAEITRLEAVDAPERLIITDIALERPTVEAILRFAEMNASRPGREHQLIVLDHHASSTDWLGALDFGVVSDEIVRHESARYYTLPGQDEDGNAPWTRPIIVLIDDTRSATKIAYDHRDLYPGPARDPHLYANAACLDTLVECVDAIDLWRRDRAIFPLATAINDGFWESVGTFIPEGHPDHDRFVSEVLLDLASFVETGKAWIIDDKVAPVRRDVIRVIFAAHGLKETPDQRDEATRMRAARLVAETDGLFIAVPGDERIHLAYGMDSGVFQRVSDVMLSEGRAALVINVFRGGQMSLRSRQGEALALASRLGGGGHPNAAGASLAATGVFSIEDGRDRLAALLAPSQEASRS